MGFWKNLFLLEEMETDNWHSRDCPINPAPAPPNGNDILLAYFNGTSQVGHTFSEDCLSVNVWTEPQCGEKKKAVLLWIYGGGKQTRPSLPLKIDAECGVDECSQDLQPVHLTRLDLMERSLQTVKM